MTSSKNTFPKMLSQTNVFKFTPSKNSSLKLLPQKILSKLLPQKLYFQN